MEKSPITIILTLDEKFSYKGNKYLVKHFAAKANFLLAEFKYDYSKNKNFTIVYLTIFKVTVTGDLKSLKIPNSKQIR